MKRTVTSALTALVTLTVPITAFAGNDDEILIGTQGARLGGAVTATVTDSTALWYNPGAIGRTRWAQFGVSGTLVQARYTKSSFTGFPDGEDASDFNLGVTPSTLGHEIPLPGNMAFSYGIFTSQDQNRVFQAATNASSFSRTTYNFGAGLGVPLATSLRVGVGVFGTYATATSSFSPNGGPATSSRRESLGTFASVGLHWAPSTALSMGLAFNTPRLTVGGTNTLDGRDTQASHNAQAPMRVRGGIAYDFGTFTLSVDGDVQPALTAGLVDRRMIPNARVGASLELDEQTHLGVGAFTDLGPERDKSQRMDFFGFCGGLETTTRYKLDPNEPAESIELTAFIGLRYAYGTGHIDGNTATAHELGLNLGSGLRF